MSSLGAGHVLPGTTLDMCSPGKAWTCALAPGNAGHVRRGRDAEGREREHVRTGRTRAVVEGADSGRRARLETQLGRDLK